MDVSINLSLLSISPDQFEVNEKQKELLGLQIWDSDL